MKLLNNYKLVFDIILIRTELCIKMLSIVSQLNLVKCQKWDENVTFLKKDPKYVTFTSNIAKKQ